MDQIESTNAFSREFLEKLSILKQERAKAVADLSASGRTDEARFSRIQMNIVEIFEKMYHASVKMSPSQEHLETIGKSYMSYFETIPKNWQLALEEAKQFGNHEAVHIETLKLAQAEAIKTMFVEALSRIKS